MVNNMRNQSPLYVHIFTLQEEPSVAKTIFILE